MYPFLSTANTGTNLDQARVQEENATAHKHKSEKHVSATILPDRNNTMDTMSRT